MIPCSTQYITHYNIKLGVDVDNSVFSVYYRQGRYSPTNKHVDSSDEGRLWCGLSHHTRHYDPSLTSQQNIQHNNKPHMGRPNDSSVGRNKKA